MIPREYFNHVNCQTPFAIYQSTEKLIVPSKIPSPNFRLSKSRYSKGQELPSFMQNINNRIALTGLSFEMLKANKYSDNESKEPSIKKETIEPKNNEFNYNSYFPPEIKKNKKKYIK